MKLIFKIFIIALFCMLQNSLIAQKKYLTPLPHQTSNSLFNQIESDNNINADSTFKILTNWNEYPTISKTGINYLYYYKDALYGEIPFRVFIPSTYVKTRKFPCILLLHGAVGLSKFSDAYTLMNDTDGDLLYSNFKKDEYIIIRPIADGKRKFDWVLNEFENTSPHSSNLTFKVLNDILKALKSELNIDDDKVFAIGHSDGSDGSVAMGVYSPNLIAGVAAYNSMLINIFAKDFYIRNIINTPLYIAHSSLDDLRPIEQTRLIVNKLNEIDSHIIYKEYIGYKHYDKHLNKDLPYVSLFLNTVSRDAFAKQVFWQTEKSSIFNECKWISVTAIDTVSNRAQWDTDFNVNSYNKRDKVFMQDNYYRLNDNACIKGEFFNNTFYIESSRVKQFKLLISPLMANLEEPITVIVNNKKVFSGLIRPDKSYIIENFKNNFDRTALWVNQILIDIKSNP